MTLTVWLVYKWKSYSQAYDFVSLFSILPSKLKLKCYNYGFRFWMIEKKMETSSGSRIHLKSSDCEISAILFLFSALEFWLPTLRYSSVWTVLEVLENDAFTRTDQIFRWPVQNLFVQVFIDWIRWRCRFYRWNPIRSIWQLTRLKERPSRSILL